MTREYGHSVYQYDNKDCWRSSFLEENEKTGLVGITPDQLKYIKAVPYQPGTMIYLEDAPYFLEHKIHHRICGPYKVAATTQMPKDGKSVHAYDDKIIVFRLNNTKNKASGRGSVRIKQTAGSHENFPFRFRIKPLDQYKVRLITHEVNCTLCSKRYDSSVFRDKKPIRAKPRLIKSK